MRINPDIRYQPRGSSDDLISAKEEVKSPIQPITRLFNTSESDDPEALIDIKVTNPLKKLYKILEDIKKHQATTFSLKFTIPLVALPLFLFAAFQLGRGEAICRQNTVSRTGLLMNIMVDVPQDSIDQAPVIGTILKLFGWQESTSKYETEDRAVLMDSTGSTVTVLHPDKISLKILTICT